MTESNILYAIVFKDTLKLLTPEESKRRFPNYGQNELYGWRPPKKVYNTLPKAKAGFAHIPDSLKKELCIHPFGPVGEVLDGEALMAEQHARREKLAARAIKKEAARRAKAIKEELAALKASYPSLPW